MLKGKPFFKLINYFIKLSKSGVGMICTSGYDIENLVNKINPKEINVLKLDSLEEEEQRKREEELNKIIEEADNEVVGKIRTMEVNSNNEDNNK